LCTKTKWSKKNRTAFSLFAYLIKLIKNTSRPRRIRKTPIPIAIALNPPESEDFRGVRRCSDSILHIIYWPALKDTKSGKDRQKKYQTNAVQTNGYRTKL